MIHLLFRLNSMKSPFLCRLKMIEYQQSHVFNIKSSKMSVVVTIIITINQYDLKGITLLQKVSVSASVKWTH